MFGLKLDRAVPDSVKIHRSLLLEIGTFNPYAAGG